MTSPVLVTTAEIRMEQVSRTVCRKDEEKQGWAEGLDMVLQHSI